MNHLYAIWGGVIILLVVIILWFILSRSSSTPTSTPSSTPSPKTTRELLNLKCPLSGSETRNGVVYINPTNIATRDDYLFSGCVDAGTCDSTMPDPISKRIINAPERCGAWWLDSDASQPIYRFNPTQKKWVKNGDKF